MRKVAVIGAGPAGIIASAYSSKKGNEVYLFERNEKIGKKLFITGKGRCNLTNAADIEELIENVSVNKSFMYSGFYSFTNDDIINLIESYGVKLKVERGNRVFPKSDKSSDILKAFNKLLRDNKVNLYLNSKINDINIDNNGKFLIEYQQKKGKESMEFDSVIISTGGASYPSTGSRGDGYKFAKKFGHNIIDIKPALVPCEIKEKYIKDLQGLSLRNIRIKAYVGKEKIFEDFGEMLFTHFGISGPIVLSMSNYINKYVKDNIDIYIDLKPALDYKKLDNRILREFENNSKKQFKNILPSLLPNKMIPVIIKLSGISGEKYANQISREERKKLVEIMKNLKLSFKSFRPISEAIVTSGGVDLNQVNPSTMESKIVDNLYFAGEVLDLHAKTGGYNLQIAYSTGYLAGSNS